MMTKVRDDFYLEVNHIDKISFDDMRQTVHIIMKKEIGGREFTYAAPDAFKLYRNIVGLRRNGQ